jgi:hypothetical protein
LIDAHLEEPPAWCTEDLSGLDDDYAADEGQPMPSSAGTPFEYALLKDLKPNLASQFVIKELLPRAALGCCYAQPGAGKTRSSSTWCSTSQLGANTAAGGSSANPSCSSHWKVTAASTTA